MKKIKLVKFLFITIGLLSLLLGIIGIFLPLLPTTPFLLLSAFLFAKSSPKLYIFLITNKYFGEYIKNYKDGKGALLSHKILTIILLWLTISSTALLVISNFWIKLLLFFIAICATIHLIMIKTYKTDNHIRHKKNNYKKELIKEDL
jgi:uncharacterized membrane protein YbaN (DUF454 family)